MEQLEKPAEMQQLGPSGWSSGSGAPPEVFGLHVSFSDPQEPGPWRMVPLEIQTQLFHPVRPVEHSGVPVLRATTAGSSESLMAALLSGAEGGKS